MNARRNRRLTADAREALRRQTLHVLISKAPASWAVQRIWLARIMGWSLSYVDYLRHNKMDELERVATVLNTEERWAERQAKRRSER